MMSGLILFLVIKMGSVDEQIFLVLFGGLKFFFYIYVQIMFINLEKFIFFYRIIISVGCFMNLRDYLMDEQMCDLELLIC